MPRLQVRTKRSARSYEITIGSGILSETGRIARGSFNKSAQRVAVVSNAQVFALYGADVVKSLRGKGFLVTHTIIPSGERHKSFRTAEKLLQFLSLTGLDRGDGVVALGGGVVGDLTGFTASIFLRGVPFIEIPTTLLAQIDASVGGKTAVNLASGKNLAGTFHQPSAVVIDIETLRSLPERELIAGFCEVVKQATIAGPRLFDQTLRFLRTFDPKRVEISDELQNLVLAHCAFKASIVAEDELEDVKRTDRRSRRVLNFGHTIGHALEVVTNYRYFRHGEAVGYGMLAAATLSKNLGILKESELELLTEAVRLCGPLPTAKNLDQDSILDAISKDKKRVAGENQWVLLERIGRPQIVSGNINRLLLKKSLREALQ